MFFVVFWLIWLCLPGICCVLLDSIELVTSRAKVAERGDPKAQSAGHPGLTTEAMQDADKAESSRHGA